jgi:hypothetical protein
MIIILVLAVFLLSPMLRPRERPQVVIIQREQDYNSSGFNPLSLFLIVVMLFIFLKSDVLKNIEQFTAILSSDTEYLPSKSQVSSKDVIKDNKILYPYVNTIIPVNNPIDNSNTKDLTVSIPALNPSPLYNKEEITKPKPKLDVFWVVLVKRFQSSDSERFYNLQKHFLNRNIEPVIMDNGELWAVIYIENEEQGKIEVRDWKRHSRDWDYMNLILEVIDLNNN